MDQKLVARFDEDKKERSFIVRSPAVGVLDRVPNLGGFQNPLAGFAALTVLGKQQVLVLPHNVSGRVVEQLVTGMNIAVEYNQPLFRLEVDAEEYARIQSARQRGPLAQTPDGLIAVPSPSEGIFYRRASADSPPYVEVGDRVQRGSVLGLVEVMKCFNQIVYGGPGCPDRATVVSVQADDGTEVTFGAPLFHVKPEE
jgi:acetyl-CoA carboxylase biotin carboxyl carrier protein